MSPSSEPTHITSFLAIDIAIGGPPCVDYSNVNGRRKGTKGKEGSYMVRFGRLIQEIQQHCHQKGHHLLFMAENVPLENDQNEPLDEGDLELVKAAFGLEWSIDLDAMYFSPARRKRTFLSNIPLDTVQSDYFEERVSISCLKGCYQYVANIKNPTMIVKANCFMASKTKVDDDRMIVLKMDKKSCKQRFMKTHEREDMMGYPTKYVETPGMFLVVPIEGCVQ